jgi:hypothetical protein
MHGCFGVRALLLILISLVVLLPAWAGTLGPPGLTAQQTIEMQAVKQLVFEQILARAVLDTWPPVPSVQMVRAWRVRANVAQTSETMRRVDRGRKWPQRILMRPLKTCPPG